MDSLGPRSGAPAGTPVQAYLATGIAAGDATPGGARRRSGVSVQL
ncbi:hypothetical protein [Streptomyces graminilatus]